MVQPEFQQQSFLSSDGFGVASPSDVSVRSYTEDRVAKARRVAPGDGVARSSSTSVYAEPRRVDVWPRRVNVWGQTICCELLRHSQLVILQCTSRDLQEDEKLVSPTEVLAKCEPVANALHLWKVVILAAPKELLTLRGECRFAVCARHGVDTKKHPLPIIDEELQILHCMHPSGTIASLFWSEMTTAVWKATCAHVVTQVLANLKLEVWQDPLMTDSLQTMLLGEFSVVGGQSGFLVRANARAKQTSAQRVTAETHLASGSTPYQQHENPKSLRSKLRAQVPAGNLEPNVMKVVQASRGVEKKC